ncbi:MAG: DNA mismatch repair endonuclease MutL [Mariprofundaceae bacterium]|nr:DNA mismatch repair endonuclease MutL [Mariprofundaceae bacterium]
MQTIHVLDPLVANQIAAGEVVERPVSVIKELVENSLDAGATHIRVRIEQAGKQLIDVDDNGCGMSEVDAALSLQRHATSKVQLAEDLHTIASHGFRGEALPSIASVSRFRMLTAQEGEEAGHEITVDGDAVVVVRPAAPRQGTHIQIRDLFFNTPARRRFLRTDRTEETLIVELMRQFALAYASIHIELFCQGKKKLHYAISKDEKKRLSDVLGADFVSNSSLSEQDYEGIVVRGYFSLPTFHYRDNSKIRFFVNGRLIQDRSLLQAMKMAYQDVMFHDRFPWAVIWIELDPAEVDVNVHPSKKEVRFRQPQKVRSAVVMCARQAIEASGQTAVQTSPIMEETEKPMRAQQNPMPSVPRTPSVNTSFSTPQFQSKKAQVPTPEITQALLMQVAETDANYQEKTTLNLGRPLAQIHHAYIVSQTESGIMLIDQHAAAERITFEAMKKQLHQGNVSRQHMLLPMSFEVNDEVAQYLEKHANDLGKYGFTVEEKEAQWLIVAVPSLLGKENPVLLLDELLESMMCIGLEMESGRILERWLGNHACRQSVKAGQTLDMRAQESLLRQMEQTANIAQCNHGRPTYIPLSLDELDRMFGRKG